MGRPVKSTALRFALAIAAAALHGCGGDRFRVVEGPATLSVAGTAFTPGVTVQIEEGGRAWFGPDAPPPETSGD